MSEVNASAVWQSRSDADGYRIYRDGVFVADVTPGSAEGHDWVFDSVVGAEHSISIEAYRVVGSNVLTGPRTSFTATVVEEA